MSWLTEICEDSAGQLSVKRVGLLIATVSLSSSAMILSVAFYLGHDTSAALAAVCVPLAGLNGYSYVGGLGAEKKA